jgi:hypothetical protein
MKSARLGLLGEAGRVEFRAEIFNIFNRVNLGVPNRNVYAAKANVETPIANVGQFIATANDAREVQLALKLIF